MLEREQPGCIVKIRREIKRAKKLGLEIGTEHVIQSPPKGKISNGMGVWVANSKGRLHFLNFYEFVTTAKGSKVKRKRRRK